MCGICGFVGLEQDFLTYEKTKDYITKMTTSLAHRGPDGAGEWIDMDRRVAFGHRRLSIVDLSENGKQPMISQSGRYVITFNGEIYNYPELQTELETAGVRMRSTCDTEVLLEYIALHGIDKALKRATGMFGLAVYDREEHKIHLARDRFGEKSVYYGWNKGRFLFGSELKALKAFPFFEPELDKDSIYMYLKYRYIKSPWSIYQGIHKMLPGKIVTLDLNTNKLSEREYYNLEEVVCRGERNLTDASLEECVDELDNILTEVIKRQLRADVPVGLFLSSGIDSAVTSAIAQKVCNGKLKTYSIGSYDEKLNEAVLAKEYAKILGTEHHEYYLDDKECMELLFKIPAMYDEPFGQPSAVPTYLVSRMARKDVTVAISGDGGDELFVGYQRDIKYPVQYRYLLKEEEYSRFSGIHDYLQYAMFKVVGFTDELWDGDVPKDRHYRQFGSNRIHNILNNALHYEAKTFMESETLLKVDRASMANSLEVREPFLDPSVVEYAFRLPETYKYDKGCRKVILKKLLEKYLPRELFDIPKRGFHIPINQYWFTDSFQEVMSWAFDESTLEKCDVFDVKKAKSAIDKMLKQGTNIPVQSIVYNILMLELWLKENGRI